MSEISIEALRATRDALSRKLDSMASQGQGSESRMESLVNQGNGRSSKRDATLSVEDTKETCTARIMCLYDQMVRLRSVADSARKAGYSEVRNSGEPGRDPGSPAGMGSESVVRVYLQGEHLNLAPGVKSGDFLDALVTPTTTVGELTRDAKTYFFSNVGDRLRAVVCVSSGSVVPACSNVAELISRCGVSRLFLNVRGFDDETNAYAAGFGYLQNKKNSSPEPELLASLGSATCAATDLSYIPESILSEQAHVRRLHRARLSSAAEAESLRMRFGGFYLLEKRNVHFFERYFQAFPIISFLSILALIVLTGLLFAEIQPPGRGLYEINMAAWSTTGLSQFSKVTDVASLKSWATQDTGSRFITAPTFIPFGYARIGQQRVTTSPCAQPALAASGPNGAVTCYYEYVSATTQDTGSVQSSTFVQTNGVSAYTVQGYRQAYNLQRSHVVDVSVSNRESATYISTVGQLFASNNADFINVNSTRLVFFQYALISPMWEYAVSVTALAEVFQGGLVQPSVSLVPFRLTLYPSVTYVPTLNYVRFGVICWLSMYELPRAYRVSQRSAGSLWLFLAGCLAVIFACCLASVIIVSTQFAATTNWQPMIAAAQSGSSFTDFSVLATYWTSLRFFEGANLAACVVCLLYPLLYYPTLSVALDTLQRCYRKYMLFLVAVFPLLLTIVNLMYGSWGFSSAYVLGLSSPVAQSALATLQIFAGTFDYSRLALLTNGPVFGAIFVVVLGIVFYIVFTILMPGIFAGVFAEALRSVFFSTQINSTAEHGLKHQLSVVYKSVYDMIYGGVAKPIKGIADTTKRATDSIRSSLLLHPSQDLKSS